MYHLQKLSIYNWMFYIQSSLTYPDLTYPDYSLIWTPVWKPFINIYIYRKCLTYLDIQLSGQSAWELSCPDKWGSTVVYYKSKKYVVASNTALPICEVFDYVPDLLHKITDILREIILQLQDIICINVFYRKQDLWVTNLCGWY